MTYLPGGVSGYKSIENRRSEVPFRASIFVILCERTAEKVAAMKVTATLQDSVLSFFTSRRVEGGNKETILQVIPLLSLFA